METHTPDTPTDANKPRGKSCLISGLAIFAILVIAIGALIFWYNRPIRPVVLTEPEQAAIEQKVAAIHAAGDDPPLKFESSGDPGELIPPPDYVPGSREIVFTDRELNGLLNEHTQLGDQIAIQFVPGAVLARIEAPLPEDVPIMGGRKLRARAKFAVDATGPTPILALQDLTVWGISVPNDWLGGIKNTNILGEAIGVREGQGIPGVESLAIERGQLVLKLKE